MKLTTVFAGITGLLCLVSCATSPVSEKSPGETLVSYQGDLGQHGWNYLASEKGKVVYIPFEGFYESKGGRFQSPDIVLDKAPGTSAYYELSFKAKASSQCYWWVDSYDRAGNLLPDNNSAVYPDNQLHSYREVFYAGEKVHHICLAFVSSKGVSVSDIVLKRSSAEAAAQWCDEVYATMPPIRFDATQKPANLPKTAAALKSGKPWRIVMLGDSILNDTYNSMFHALVKRDFPNSNCTYIISVRGSTGCWYYQKPEHFKTYVADLKPDLLIIGGISNPSSGDWPQAIANVIGQAKKLGCEILLAMPPMSSEWRKPISGTNLLPQPKQTWNEQTTGFQNRPILVMKPYLDVAAKTGVPVWNLTKQCADYRLQSGKPIGWFNRDVIHNNDRGKQVIGRFMQANFKLLDKLN